MAKLILWEGGYAFTFLPKNQYIKYDRYNFRSFLYGKEKTIPNHIFYLEINFDGFSRGRSSATASFFGYLKNTNTKIQVDMFLKDLSEAILSGSNVKELKGYFCFQKRGSNIGIRYLGKEVPISNLELKELNLEYFKGE